ncbi:MAG: PIN domain-containing protein [Deferrisomatales bacterium]|nr:PIN domain-containing protein [Deferrisomatales bacterium]
MGSAVFRTGLFLICFVAGALAGPALTSWEQAPLAGAAVGVALFAAAYVVERSLQRAPPSGVLGAALGALGGLLAAVWARRAFGFEVIPAPAAVGITVVLAYVGALAGQRGIRAFRLATGKSGVAASVSPKVLDTSAIIDGRIADMVELGFIGGPMVVPQFVLNEVQGIADSTDPLKRARGRRGLGILERLQALEGIEVRITDHDFPRVKEVDGKIVALAKSTGATVVTNDFNLSKVAELQGVRTLNVNQLAHALRPVVLPGEEVQVTVQKEGKEPGQGVGYLEDGTMVVVEGGGDRMGQSIRGVVTSVLQTTAGRLIFAKPAGEEGLETPARRRVWRRRA